jgi:hypothetical protein
VAANFLTYGARVSTCTCHPQHIKEEVHYFFYFYLITIKLIIFNIICTVVHLLQRAYTTLYTMVPQLVYTIYTVVHFLTFSIRGGSNVGAWGTAVPPKFLQKHLTIYLSIYCAHTMPCKYEV